MKYWTIIFNGEHGQFVRETWSEEQIISSYYPYWKEKMLYIGREDLITKERCLEDWIIVQWVEETDRFGKRLCKNKT